MVWECHRRYDESYSDLLGVFCTIIDPETTSLTCGLVITFFFKKNIPSKISFARLFHHHRDALRYYMEGAIGDEDQIQSAHLWNILTRLWRDSETAKSLSYHYVSLVYINICCYSFSLSVDWAMRWAWRQSQPWVSLVITEANELSHLFTSAFIVAAPDWSS